MRRTVEPIQEGENMEGKYIGTKIIVAEEMDEETFLAKHRNGIGRMFNPAARLGYKVRHEDGYISWSPKGTFERAHRKMTDAEISLIRGEYEYI